MRVAALSVECGFPRVACPRGTDLRTQQVNGLLASLAEAELARLMPMLELVDLPQGKVLYESGAEATHAYFPVTAIASLECVTATGNCVEIAIVGNEGLVGIALFMGGHTTPSRALVQRPGLAYRLRAADMRAVFDMSGPVLHLFLRFTQALITQMCQTAVCNRHHSIHQQLCRMLLLSHDRVIGDEILMTHEHLSNMLGVRRESITAEATRLQVEGAIRYHRGHITILDRSKLEASTCECYAVVKHEYDRLLPAEIAVGRTVALTDS
jgi:CRP-like cAMP-binding protein